MQGRPSFFKYVSGEVAQCILERQRLRWSAPSKFNDVFDVPRILKFGYSSEEFHGALREALASIIENGANEPPFAKPKIRALLLDIRLAVNIHGASFSQIAADVRDGNPELTKLTDVDLDWIQEYWRELTSRMRILCMTEKCDSRSMWAYYGEHSRGAVFEFEAPRWSTSSLLKMRQVSYSESPPKLLSKEELASQIIGERQLDWAQFFHEYQFTKYLEFSHESEWRVVQSAKGNLENGYSDLAFHPRELRRIIFGAQCPAMVYQAVFNLLRQRRWRHVALARANVDHWSIRVEPVARE